MTEEFKHEHDHECLCHSKGFKKFIVVALGTFVGGFCAISLFWALHKPPMIPYGPYPMHPMMMQGGHNCNCPCYKIMMGKKFEKYRKEFKDFTKEEKEDAKD